MKFIIDASVAVLFIVIWLGITTFLRMKKKKSSVYLFFFAVFYIYIFKVLDYTLFQFQSLLLLKYFMPELLLNGLSAEESVNLIPLLTLTPEDVKTSLLNILLFVPFGFGLPFITNFRMNRIVLCGVVFSIGIELLQFISGLIAGMTFRIADINDVIFNTIGAAIGYVPFLLFLRVYRRMFPNREIPANAIAQYIANRPQGTGRGR